MSNESKRKRHTALLADLLRYGWQVEACYVNGSPRWCSASVDADGRHVFCRASGHGMACAKATRTPPFADAGDRLTFVVMPYGQGKPNKIGHAIRTWGGLRRFVDNKRAKWVLAEIKAGHFGETARQHLERVAQ